MTTCTSLVLSDETTVYIAGPPPEKGPLPTLLYFALSGHESLTLDPINAPVAALEGEPIRCISLDLPEHPRSANPKLSMRAMKRALRQDPSLLPRFIQQTQQALDELEARELLDPTRLAVAGVSRGGYVALHLAAEEPRVQSVLGFAPVTDPFYLEDLQDLREDPLYSTKLGWEGKMDQLAKKRIRCYIGNHDERVGVASCFSLITDLVAKAVEQKVRSPQIELRIFPSIGFQGHGTPPNIFLEGARWVAQQLLS